MQHGPFTPQECDAVVKWLQSKSIAFQLIKDEAAERAFTLNDGQNVVRRTEFRTETFLAQLFYVEIPEMPDAERAEFSRRFLPPEEKAPASLNNALERDFSLHRDAQHGARQKRFWARLLAAAWIAVAIYSLYSILRQN